MNKLNLNYKMEPNHYNRYTWILGNPVIAPNVWIKGFCLIDALHESIKIGRRSDISSSAQVLTHSTVQRYVSERRFSEAGTAATEIGKFVFTGTNTVVLMDAKIGNHSVIAARSVVPQQMQIPPYSLVAGVPAKIIGSSKKYLKEIDEESISVVIPAFNEQVTIKNVLKEAGENLKKLKIPFEIVVINDGSTDKTKQIVEGLIKKTKDIRLVNHLKNRGFTGAMRTSFQSAKKHLIFLAPADGQFDFSELGNFVEAIKGNDVAIGYRVKNEEGFKRRLNSRLFHFLCATLFGIKLKEISTVSLWRKRVTDSIKIQSDDRSAMFLPELIYKALGKKYRFIQVPISWYLRKGGAPKGASPLVIVNTLRAMFQLWLKIAQK